MFAILLNTIASLIFLHEQNHLTHSASFQATHGCSSHLLCNALRRSSFASLRISFPSHIRAILCLFFAALMISVPPRRSAFPLLLNALLAFSLPLRIRSRRCKSITYPCSSYQFRRIARRLRSAAFPVKTVHFHRYAVLSRAFARKWGITPPVPQALRR